MSISGVGRDWFFNLLWKGGGGERFFEGIWSMMGLFFTNTSKRGD
jgi:hypothetical protein